VQGFVIKSGETEKNN